MSVEILKRKLNLEGFSIVHPFCTNWYNDYVKQRVPGVKNLIELEKNRVGLLIGNTKSIWPKFKNWYDKEGYNIANPFDTYVTKSISKAVHEDGMIYWGYETQNYLIALQQVARVSGFAYLDPNLHLCVHPQFGSWFSLRAVLLLPNECFLPKPIEVDSLVTQEEQEEIKQLSLVENPDWKHWVKLRSVPQIGKNEKFSEEQILYHYTKTMF